MARLMFVTWSLTHGGAERQSVNLINRLVQRGHECHSVYIKAPADLADRLRLGPDGTVLGLYATRYFDVRAVKAFARHIAAVEPEAIMAANPYSLMYSWIALRLARRRAALTFSYHSNRLLGVKEWLQMLVYRPLFWTSACSIFVCDRQRRYWSRRGVCARRSVVIYNGVDTREFSDAGDPAQRTAVRTALGIRESDYLVGIAALLRPEKNHRQLVDAIASLRDRGLPARALLIGDGEMREAIERHARARGVEEHILIAGMQRDVRPYVVACDAMVLCSFTEAFSLAAIEAMALGRPMVHSDVGGAAEMIDPGRTGFLFPVGDTPALVDALAKLADRPVARRMGQAARAEAVARFSETEMVNRYEQTLLALVERSDAVPRAAT